MCVSPRVAIMSPPCKALRGYSELNRVLNPVTFEIAHEESCAIADFAIDIAEYQGDHGRWWLNEHPVRTEMYELPKWKALERKQDIRSAVFDQCQAGAVAPNTGIPVRKRSDVRSNDERLIYRLRKFQCKGRKQCPQHRIVDGSISARMRVWPWLMATTIADGCCEVIRDDWANERKLGYMTTYPTAARIERCEMCARGGISKYDPRHIRRGDCLHADVEPQGAGCPGCMAGQPRDHHSHVPR